MLALPFKRPDGDADWAGALDRYIRRAYSARQADAHAAAGRLVDETRRLAFAQPLTEKTAGLLRAALLRYLRLLGSLERRFDLGELELASVWRSAFNPSAKQREPSAQFERAAALYNLAAVLSFEATAEQRSDADGIRRACQLLQLAAGLLDRLRELVAAEWAGGARHAARATRAHSKWSHQPCLRPWRRCGDLCDATLDAMRTLLLAQAQRCYYERAAADGLSPRLLSVTASQTGTFYAQTGAAAAAPPVSRALSAPRSPFLRVGEQLRASPASPRVDSSWGEAVGLGAAVFDSLALLHRAEEHAAANEYGHQVARLAAGVERLRSALAASAQAAPKGRRASATVAPVSRAPLEAALARLEEAHAQADKDNTIVYLEPLPPASALSPVRGKAIVRPRSDPLEALEEEAWLLEGRRGEGDGSGPAAPGGEADPFAHLVPHSVQPALLAYASAAREALDGLHTRLEEERDSAASALLALDLPHALEAVEAAEAAGTAAGGGSGTLPLALTGALTAVHKSGGPRVLKALAGRLVELQRASEASARGVGSVLAAEAAAEAEMAARFGEAWRASRGSGAIAELRSELDRCLARLAEATAANKAVLERAAAVCAAEAAPLLELPLSEVASRMPAAPAEGASADPASSAALRAALDALAAHADSRAAICAEASELQRPTRRLVLQRPTPKAQLGVTISACGRGDGDGERGEFGVVIEAVGVGTRSARRCEQRLFTPALL